MRNGISVALAVWLIAAAALLAQTPDSPTTVYQAPPLAPVVAPTQPAPAPYLAPEGFGPPAISAPHEYVLPPGPSVVVAAPEPFHIWVKAELLAWWVKDAPLPAPIALVTNANGNLQTIIGNANAGFGAFAGGRVAFGAWFDQHNNYGFETSFFSLERRSNHQSAFSDGNGNPAIGLSYLSATPGQAGEFLLPLATPGTLDGNVLVTSTLELWGAEVNGAVCLLRAGALEFTTLAGFRYLDLQENLYITSGSTDLTTGDFTGFSDRFFTHNQFYGGQLGARVNWHGDRLSLDATGKLALGGTHQVVNIQGSSLASTGDLFASGFYAQPSNIGRYTANQFSLIPSLELKFNYQFSRWWRLFVGYDFLYWNQVIRPGNQMDRNINLTQSPILGNGALAGPAAPTLLFNRSDFWAHGITLGLELRF